MFGKKSGKEVIKKQKKGVGQQQSSQEKVEGGWSVKIKDKVTLT